MGAVAKEEQWENHPLSSGCLTLTEHLSTHLIVHWFVTRSHSFSTVDTSDLGRGLWDRVRQVQIWFCLLLTQ